MTVNELVDIIATAVASSSNYGDLKSKLVAALRDAKKAEDDQRAAAFEAYNRNRPPPET